MLDFEKIKMYDVLALKKGEVKMTIDKKYYLRQLRGLRSISQETLAEKTGVTVRTMWNYENDLNKLRSAPYSVLKKIAQALDVSIDDIKLDDTSK